MSGLSSLGSSLASSPASSTSLLSAVGQSLLTSGQAPNAATTAPAATTKTSTLTPYQSEYATLQQQDTAELLYASFLSPADSLANTDAVLGQAANLLGTPGSTPAAAASSSTASSSTSSASSSSTDPLANLPSISSILSASDQVAQQTLNAYSSAPAGSSILDYQA